MRLVDGQGKAPIDYIYFNNRGNILQNLCDLIRSKLKLDLHAC